MSRFLSMPLLALALALPAAAQQAATTPALDALAAGAANPSCAMNGVTGEACSSTDVSAVASSTSAAKPAVTTPAITHQDTVVPSPSAAKKKSGSFMKGIKKYFDDDKVKEGTAFGAAIGMLLLAASPVGIIGGALIGVALGAIICGGLIQKIFHHFFK